MLYTHRIMSVDYAVSIAPAAVEALRIQLTAEHVLQIDCIILWFIAAVVLIARSQDEHQQRGQQS